MKFNSIKEYFYKLTNGGYQRMMLPLILFTLYFGQSSFMLFQPFLSNETLIDPIFYGIVVVTILCLTTVQVVYHFKFKSYAEMIGLGLKLENYGAAALHKMNWISIAALLQPLGLFVTADNRLAINFVVVVAWFFLQWPSPKTVARQLRLKGDERTMVVTRGEAFKI